VERKRKESGEVRGEIRMGWLHEGKRRVLDLSFWRLPVLPAEPLIASSSSLGYHRKA